MGKKVLRTLEDVLEADQVGSMIAEMQRPFDEYTNANPEATDLAKRAVEKMEQFQAEDESFVKKFAAIDQSTLKGKREVCRILNITLEELQALDEFEKGLEEASKKVTVPSPDSLVRSWRVLKARAKIQDIDATNFPKEFERPTLVLYSDDWCPPCRMKRPTFARLVPFYDKADVRYCCDKSLYEKLSPRGIPQFIMHFPDGTTQQRFLGESAAEIWWQMNHLAVPVVTAADFANHVCTDESCQILPDE